MIINFRSILLLSLGYFAWNFEPALAAGAKTTREGAVACETLGGLEDFWFGVDKLPSGVSQSEFKSSIGCVSLPGGLAFTQLEEITARVLAVQGQVWLQGKSYKVWLAESDVR